MKTEMASHLGRYQIDAEIGRGAMGLVYQAHDPKIDRQVAIKTISLFTQEVEEEQEFRERFFIEARAAGRLSHPGIVTIFDVGEDPTTHEPYIVMEFVAGQPLNKILSGENRKLPLDQALQITQEIAEALNYAHTQGVVHRDIKPANILITLDGHPKIADFGIAKVNQGLMTVPGQVLGSPAYMAPEQLSGENTDSRSDLFSLGVILYSMLTGFRPFQGNSAATVGFKVVNRDPLPVTAFDPDFPAALDRLVSRAIAKDPAKRYQTGMEMAQEIQILRERRGFLEQTAVPVRRIASPEPRVATKVSTTRVTASKPAKPAAITAKRISAGSRVFFGKMVPDEIALSAAIVLVLATGFIAYEAIHSGKPRTATINAATVQSHAPVAAVVGAVPTVDDAAPKDGPDDARLDRLIAEEEGPVPAPTSQVKPVRKPRVKVAAKPPAHKDASKLSGPLIAAKSSSPAKSPNSLQNVKAVSAAPAAATLQIQIEYQFAEAEASIWIDNQLTYKQKLFGESKKRALLFKKMEGHEVSSVNVPAGEHQIHVRVQSTSDEYDQSQTLVGKFNANGQNVLDVTCDKRGDGLQLTLK